MKLVVCASYVLTLEIAVQQNSLKLMFKSFHFQKFGTMKKKKAQSDQNYNVDMITIIAIIAKNCCFLMEHLHRPTIRQTYVFMENGNFKVTPNFWVSHTLDKQHQLEMVTVKNG